jgi:hypothetical protein
LRTTRRHQIAGKMPVPHTYICWMERHLSRQDERPSRDRLRYLNLLGRKFAQGGGALLANDGVGVIAQAVAQHFRGLWVGRTR